VVVEVYYLIIFHESIGESGLVDQNTNERIFIVLNVILYLFL